MQKFGPDVNVVKSNLHALGVLQCSTTDFYHLLQPFPQLNMPEYNTARRNSHRSPIIFITKLLEFYSRTLCHECTKYKYKTWKETCGSQLCLLKLLNLLTQDTNQCSVDTACKNGETLVNYYCPDWTFFNI